jgi:hypothetical protein
MFTSENNFMSAQGFSDVNFDDHGIEESSTKSGKVIHQKLICYVSAFQLNVNDWFNEYENIEIFNLNLSK